MVLTEICSKSMNYHDMISKELVLNQYFQHDVTHVQDVIGHKALCFTRWVMFSKV